MKSLPGVAGDPHGMATSEAPAGDALPVLSRRAALLGLVGLGAGLALPGAAEATTEHQVHLGDTARILAGMRPAAGSSLEALTTTAAFRDHERAFTNSWGRLEGAQLAKIRAWAKRELPPPRDTLFYFFSGPDYLYANAFFPEAKTYVMGGLEPVGRVPQATVGNLRGLAQLRASINSVMSFSFFLTKQMRAQLGGNIYTGTLPIIYIFLARAGKTVEETTLISLDESGKEVPAGSPTAHPAINAAKVVFTSEGDPTKRTLYYFQTDVSNNGRGLEALLAFSKALGPGDAFIKSASYLMHLGGFSRIRDFLLANAATLLQDDSGIPLRHFEAGAWNLRALGNYAGPIALFSNYHQPNLGALHRQQGLAPLPFGVGYRYRPRESSLLLATRKG